MRKIKIFIKIIIAMLALLLLFGCSGAKETVEIKPKIIKPPTIENTMDSHWIDTLFIATRIEGKDTVQVVKFIPDSALRARVEQLIKDNKSLGNKIESMGEFYLKIKPDSIVYWDTLKITQPPDIIQTPMLAKIGLVFVGMLIALIIYLFIRR